MRAVLALALVVSAACGGAHEETLPPIVVEQTLRASFGSSRVCYEEGLRRDPNLRGRVAIKLVVGRAGAVESVSTAGSDLPDQQVLDCVGRVHRKLVFRRAEGKDTTVTYGIVFTPADDQPLDAGAEAGGG